MPQSLRVGETREIKRISGLNPPEFTQAIGDLSETNDPDVSAALVWWIVHREDASFTVEMLDELEWGEIEFDAGDAPVELADPNAGGASSANSPTSADVSSVTPEGLGEMIHANGGGPALAPSGPAT